MRGHHYRNNRYVDVGVGRKIGYYYYHMWILWSCCCCCYYWLIGGRFVVVDGRPISLSEQGWKVRHGGPPVTTTSSRARESNNMGNKEEDRELEEGEKVKLQPLRVLFDTTELDVDTWNRQPQLRDTINYLKEEVLPSVATLLQETLSIVQRGKDIIDDSLSDVAWKFRLPEATCYDLLQNVDFTYNEKDPSSGYIVDMEKHDMVMFVLSNSFNNEVLKCEETTFAMSAPCLLYQSTDRPLVSIVSLCLTNLVTTLPPPFSSDPSNNSNNNINDQRLEHTILHEITHNLGFNSEMYKFYRNPRTGQPLVPRPFIKTQSINCVQKRTLKDIELPTNVIEPLFHSTTNQLKSFHMITPTVQQIVRTQFNCPHVANIAGLLENQPTNSNDCFGSHWDERYHLYNSMSSLYDQEAYFTPLTLALLEDTGWYRPNYNHPQIQISPFGLHAGCSFLTDTCVTSEGTVPSYANGYFCNQPYNTNDNNWLCDANHSARGKCDLFPSRKSPMSNNLGPFYTSADHCPLVRMDLIDCQKPSNQIYNQHYKHNHIIPNELFGPSSSCIQTNTQSLTTTTTTTTAICTTTLCNTKQKTVDITIDGTTVSCQTDFQQITIPSNTNKGYTHTITCPRISSICPQMVTCPSQCSGKGTCDFNTLKCNCFDTTDTTEGCYNSLPLPYPNNNNNNNDNNQLSDAWQSLMNMPPYPNQKKKSSSHNPHPAKTIMTIITTMTILVD